MLVVFTNIDDTFFLINSFENKKNLRFNSSRAFSANINMRQDGPQKFQRELNPNFYFYIEENSYLFGGSGVMAAWKPVELQERVQFPPTALLRKSFKINRLNKIKEVDK